MLPRRNDADVVGPVFIADLDPDTIALAKDTQHDLIVPSP
jgi:hypothetical protein